MKTTRRRHLGSLALGAGLLAGTACSAIQLGKSGAARVVVVGGGFAGASCARALQALDENLAVTLIEPQMTYTACPMSNLVLSTSRPLAAQQFGYGGIRNQGVTVLHSVVTGVDGVARNVTLSDGSVLSYDRLVLAPGISFDWQALPGLDEAAAQVLPHAWRAGAQTELLKGQLRAMPDNGLVVISVPDNPYRCPPGPYERASLIAHYLKAHKPRAKLLILDAKDRFSKQPLFMQAWQTLYGDMLEWQGLSDGARVISVDASTRTLHTDFDSISADVANVIPPQRAGAIAGIAGVADASGWCPIDPVTFESTLQADIYVIGDAAIANAMPKSAFAANAQAKYCAAQIVRSLAGLAPLPSTLINTCYSLARPDYGFSVAGVYKPAADSWLQIEGAGGISPLDAPVDVREQESLYAKAWFETLTESVFGG